MESTSGHNPVIQAASSQLTSGCVRGARGLPQKDPGRTTSQPNSAFCPSSAGAKQRKTALYSDLGYPRYDSIVTGDSHLTFREARYTPSPSTLKPFGPTPTGTDSGIQPVNLFKTPLPRKLNQPDHPRSHSSRTVKFDKYLESLLVT